VVAVSLKKKTRVKHVSYNTTKQHQFTTDSHYIIHPDASCIFTGAEPADGIVPVDHAPTLLPFHFGAIPIVVVQRPAVLAPSLPGLACHYVGDVGVKVVAITDLYGGVFDPKGLDIPGLIEHSSKTGGVAGFVDRSITNEQLFALDVDVLIPAATGHVIHEGNAGKVKAKAVVEAANMPTTVEAMDILTERGIVVIPDILANAGGVIASMEEYSRSLSAIKLEKADVFQIITQKIGQNLDASIELAKERKCTIAEAAVEIAMERVYKVMLSRRYI